MQILLPQILEEVCLKQQYSPDEYELRYLQLFKRCNECNCLFIIAGIAECC